jgi:hypothetical protein
MLAVRRIQRQASTDDPPDDRAVVGRDDREHEPVTEHQDFPPALWAENLDELDREIARLALVCQVRILDPGIILRVLQKDASVCGTDNPPAFAKLHQLLMLHLTLREKSVEALGQAKTMAIEDYVIERLKKSFPDLGKWPPA